MLYLKLIILVLVTLSVIRIYFDSRRNYPPLDYEVASTPNTAPWRWRKPDDRLSLQLKDLDDSSHLYLQGRLLGYEKLFVAMGYLLIGAVAWALVNRSFIQGHLDLPSVIVACVFLALGYGAIHVGQYVSRIVLYPDKVELVIDFGFFFRRIQIYRRNARLSFRSETESFLQLTNNHDWPRTRLYVKNGFIFSKLFTLAGNPSQNHWIVDGLQHWNAQGA